MEENNGQEETLTTQEEEVLQTSEEEQEESESLEDLKIRLAKAEELALNQKIRAEKAEKLAKSKVQTESKTNSQDLSNTDLYALMEAKVPKEDIDEVRDYAKLKNISIEEALKSSIVKATLREKAENRKSNEVSNTSGARRGTARVSDEALVDNFRKGILPESDEDFDRLVKARKAR